MLPAPRKGHPTALQYHSINLVACPATAAFGRKLLKKNINKLKHMVRVSPDRILVRVRSLVGAKKLQSCHIGVGRNKSADIAVDTQVFGRELGLKSCFTPVLSPHSKGTFEVCVKTFKRYCD